MAPQPSGGALLSATVFTMAAVLPQPPLLVPELACGAAAETDDLRAACRAVAARLAAAAPRWVAVGADAAGRRTVAAGTRGSFAGFGVDLSVALGPPAGIVDPMLALPLLIAGWAAGTQGPVPAVRGELVAPDTPAGDCAALGAALAAEANGSVGLLVLGDGAATHTEQAPGHLDHRAGPFDATVAAAFAAGDAAALAGLDVALAAELMVAGRAPWQVLAGATGAGWAGELLYSGAPYGVAYHVALWSPPLR